MSIYSSNRSTSYGLADIGFNESYANSDMGQIMYESQCNDMALFEAIIVSDLAEISALREGTMLESEAKKISKDSLKAFAARLKERIAAWWAKVKAAIRSAINKISAYMLTDGKAFVKKFEECRKKHGKFNGSVEATDLSKFDFPHIATISEIRKYVIEAKEGDLIHTKECVKNVLGGKTPKEYKESYLKVEGKKSYTDKDATALTKKMIETKATIIDIVKTEKALSKQINDLMRELTVVEKEKNNDDTATTVRNISTICSVFENVGALQVSITIAQARAQLKIAKSVLTKMMGEMKGQEEVQLNATIMVESDEIDTALDAPEEAIDDSIQKEIDDIKDAADAEVVEEIEKEDE